MVGSGDVLLGDVGVGVRCVEILRRRAICEAALAAALGPVATGSSGTAELGA